MRTKPLRYSTLWPLAVLLCSGAGARAQNALLFVEPADGTFDGFANFGTAAAISGRTAVVSAPNIAPPDLSGSASPTYPYQGVVNIYGSDAAHTAWVLTGILHADDFSDSDRYFGTGLALDGKRLIVSSAGSVFIYEKQRQAYVLQDKLSVAPDPSAPLIYDDGVLAFRVHDPDAGLEVLVYRVNERGKAHLVSTLTTPDPANPSALNGGLSYDASDQSFAIGSETADTLGRVYFYSLRGGEWVLKDSLAAPSTAADGFGAAVALWKHKLVVGAPAEDSTYDPNFNSTLYAGAVYVYVYEQRNGRWVLRQRIATDDPTSPVAGLVGFGSQIATNGRYVWITAPDANDHNFSTRPANYSTLFRWDERELTITLPRAYFANVGGLDMSRRYVLQADGDPIYGETAQILDLRLFESSQTPNSADDPDTGD